MAAHRYWRVLKLTSQQDERYALLSELQFASVAGGPNLCTGGTPIAGSEYSGLGAGNAFDGNPDTVWCSNRDSAAWIGYDFGAAVSIVECRITVNGYYPDERMKTARVECSDDNVSWTDAGTIAPNWGMDGATQTETFAVNDTTPPPPPTGFHRYWRLRWLGTWAGSRCSCTALEMMEASGGADVTGSGRAYASSESYPYEASWAFDRDYNTFWNTDDTSGNNWLAYDFGSGNYKRITEIAFTCRSDGNNVGQPRDGWFEYSDDGVNWVQFWQWPADTNWSSSGERKVFEVGGAGPTPLEPYLYSLAVVVPTIETPPPAGGAVVNGVAIVAVQVEFRQPYRNVQLPLITGPWAVPLFIAKDAN